ncbi:MAG: STY4851/ECs_5259 family protein [Methylotenera sp.]|nr:STY4851/ECs_5259 family protein [Methylotenera sp.]
MNLSQWKINFLAKNSRSDIQGAPLYAYKVSSEEFLDLKVCLSENINLYLKHYDINYVFHISKDFPQLFVLYAAIWWQREYDGSGMAWEPIFNSVGINSSELNSNIRSGAIEKGFQLWSLKLNKDIGNLKFIGNIASQGGLPLKLIATGHGNLNRLLNRVLKDVVSLAFPDHQSVNGIIESHKNELPRSYRQKEIFSLLAEIIITFLRLKADAKLESSSNAIEKLNQFEVNWRDRFPLPMDDENAKGVLERFIQDGIKIKAEKAKFSLTLERYIDVIENKVKIISQLNLPKQNIDEDSLKKCFGVDDNFLTRVITLIISNHQRSHEITIRRLAGQANYKFDFETIPRFRDAHNEHFATLKNATNDIRTLELLGGFELNQDAPWIFDASDEIDQYKFLKVGAGKFKASKLFVVVPSNFSINTSLEQKYDVEGLTDKTCYLIDSEVTFTCDDDHYNIKPRCENVIDEEYALLGERIWDIFQSPAVAYKGAPQAVKFINQSPTLRNQVSVNAVCSNLNNQNLNNQLSTYGPMHVVVKENNNITWASKIVVLPKQANLRINPSKETGGGNICLENWQISNLKCLSENVAITVNQNGHSSNIDCNYVGTNTPDEYVEFELFWQSNPKSAIIKVPFPSLGVLAFNAAGKRLGHKKSLSLQQLYGIRIVTFLQQSNFVEIELTLKDNGYIQVDPITRRVKRNQANTRLEIALIDFREYISNLLYSADQLDSKVEVRVKISGAKDFVLVVKKYDVEFAYEKNSHSFMISQAHLQNYDNLQISKCEVKATRIDDIEEDMIDLEPTVSEGVFNGVWKFPIQNHTSGCWMIHPSQSSSIQFRPMMLPLEQDVVEISDSEDLYLKEVLKIASNTERALSISTVIHDMCDNFNHKDWVHVEYLANNLGHLNLTSLDLWRLFSKNTKAMASMALRDSKLPEQFIQRFSSELPFLWEFVSLENWLDAAFYLKKQVYQKHTDEAFAQQYFEYLLINKLNSLLVNHPSLNMMFEIIKSKNGIQVNQEMQGVIGHPQVFEHVLFGQLFDGEESELQKLLRRDDEEWPSKFISEIRLLKRSDYKELMCPNDFGFKETIINLPIIMAIKSLIGEQEGWLDDENNYLDIKNIKNFDQDWFASAFDKTIARAITKGYVQL